MPAKVRLLIRPQATAHFLHHFPKFLLEFRQVNGNPVAGGSPSYVSFSLTLSIELSIRPNQHTCIYNNATNLILKAIFCDYIADHIIVFSQYNPNLKSTEVQICSIAHPDQVPFTEETQSNFPNYVYEFQQK